MVAVQSQPIEFLSYSGNDSSHRYNSHCIYNTYYYIQFRNKCLIVRQSLQEVPKLLWPWLRWQMTSGHSSGRMEYLQMGNKKYKEKIQTLLPPTVDLSAAIWGKHLVSRNDAKLALYLNSDRQ